MADETIPSGGIPLVGPFIDAAEDVLFNKGQTGASGVRQLNIKPGDIGWRGAGGIPQPDPYTATEAATMDAIPGDDGSFRTDGQKEASQVGEAINEARRGGGPRPPVGSPGEYFGGFMPEPWGGRSAFQALEGSFDGAQEAVRAGADAEKRLADEQAQVFAQERQRYEQSMQMEAQMRAQEQEAARLQLADLQAQADEIAKEKIDTGRIFQSPVGVLGAIVAGLGSMFSQDPMGGANLVNQAIQRDIQVQQANLGQKNQALGQARGIYAEYLALTKNEQLARQLTEVKLQEVAQLKLKEVAAKYQSPIVDAQAEKTIATLENQKVATMMSALRTAWSNPALMNERQIKATKKAMGEVPAYGSGFKPGVPEAGRPSQTPEVGSLPPSPQVSPRTLAIAKAAASVSPKAQATDRKMVEINRPALEASPSLRSAIAKYRDEARAAYLEKNLLKGMPYQKAWSAAIDEFEKDVVKAADAQPIMAQKWGQHAQGEALVSKVANSYNAMVSGLKPEQVNELFGFFRRAGAGGMANGAYRVGALAGMNKEQDEAIKGFFEAYAAARAQTAKDFFGAISESDARFAQAAWPENPSPQEVVRVVGVWKLLAGANQAAISKMGGPLGTLFWQAGHRVPQAGLVTAPNVPAAKRKDKPNG